MLGLMLFTSIVKIDLIYAMQILGQSVFHYFSLDFGLGLGLEHAVLVNIPV